MGESSGSKRRVCEVASLPKCDFNRDAMQLCWGYTSAWVFYEFAPYFQGTFLREHLNLSFAKALLSLIVHFKGTFTAITVLSMNHRFSIFYSFHWSFKTAVTFAWSFPIVWSCLFFLFFSIIQHFPNKLRFHHLE